jgi:glycosyltransferase involved in cell wall biosynthesis
VAPPDSALGADAAAEGREPSPRPLVTIVTPCLNIAGYIGETLESVTSQDYQPIEYILMDGGSTDGTLEIIESYCQRYPDSIRLISRQDGGAADALQQALQLAAGEIFAYINADDTYFPGAISAAVASLRQHPEVAGVYGNARWVADNHRPLDTYPTEPFDPDKLTQNCFICQPACFLRTDILRSVGGFDTRLQVAFDYELWLRIAARHRLLRIDPLLANSRMHLENKTLRQRQQGFREAISALRLHCGYVPFGWLHSYVAFRLDGRDQFFQPLRPSFTKYLLAGLYGIGVNWRRPLRFLREWAGVMSLPAFVRRWNDTWMGRCLRLRFR